MKPNKPLLESFVIFGQGTYCGEYNDEYKMSEQKKIEHFLKLNIYPSNVINVM